MKKYKNLLTSGCSFSAHTIGGVPPTKQSAGGCSYMPDPDYTIAEPESWPGFLARHMNITSLINVASPSHGNILVANTLLTCLQKYCYDPADTLVMFNLSDPHRFDLMCGYDHADADKQYIPWNSELIDYTFIHRESKTIVDIQKYLEWEYIEKTTSNCAELLMNYLQNKKYDFYFMTMNNYSQTCLAPVIDRFKDHFIALDPGPSMNEYCKSTKTRISDIDYHPNLQGHKQIADQVFRLIKTNAI